MTTPIRHPYLDHPGPIAFAHRGGAADGLENTLRQFRRAVGAGYRYIETDVHATRDGKLVAFHDGTLDRVTDGAGRIADLPWENVRHARVAGEEPVPLFEELLETFPAVRWNVDVKAEPALEPLLELIGRHNAWDRICVGSFSEARVVRAQRGLQVHVWTVNDADRMHRLLDLGVDGIMTDHIDTLRKVMEDRGVWG